MYYLIIHLFQEEYADDIIVALTEAGVSDIMVNDSVNASRRLAHNLPLFAGFRGELGKTSLSSKIFHAVIDSVEVLEQLLNSLKKADCDFHKEDMGKIILVPAEKVVVSEPDVEEEKAEEKISKKKTKRKSVKKS